MYKTTTGGSMWVSINAGSNCFTVTGIALDPTNSSTLYVAENYDQICKTTTGGLTWSNSNIGNDPSHPSTLFAGTRSLLGGYGTGILKTTNGGGSWTAVNDGLAVFNVSSMVVDPNGTAYAGTDGGGVFASPRVCPPQPVADCRNPAVPAKGMLTLKAQPPTRIGSNGSGARVP